MRFVIWMAILLGTTAAVAQEKDRVDRPGALALGGHPNLFTEFTSRPYVYLYRDHDMRLELSKWVQRDHEIIAITSAAGRDRATFRYTFHESLKFKISGATITPNNVRVDLGKDGIKTKKLGHFIEYTIVFPSVADGSILDLETTLAGDWTRTYDEHWIATEVPVLHARASVESHDGLDFVLVAKNLRNEQRVKKSDQKDDDNKPLWFEFFDVDPVGDEPMSPPRGAYSPQIVTYARNGNNWNWMAADEEPYFRAACDLTDNDEAGQLIKQRFGKESDPALKCRDIVKFVRDEIQILGGSETMDLYPQPATETLEGRAGTATDAAALAVGLMRRAGMDVRLALVRRKSSGDWLGTVYKSLQFDRFLPYVKLGNSWHWLDPLCAACGFDDLNDEYCGTTAILFQSDVGHDIDRIFQLAQSAESWQEFQQAVWQPIQNARWTDIVNVCPAPQWIDTPESSERIMLKVDASGTVNGEFDWALTGGEKLSVRAMLLEMPEAGRPEWLTEKLQARLPGVELAEHSFFGLEPDFRHMGSADTLRIHARFSTARFPVGDRVRVPAPLLSGLKLPTLGSGTRRAPVWEGRAGNRHFEVVLEMPDDYRCLSKPDPVDADCGVMRFRSRCDGDAQVLSFAQDYKWERCALAPEAFSTLRDNYAKITAATTKPVEFGRGGASK
jgi:hypothetical protein